MQAKQVIVMKKFPGLRTGKYVAQGSHASVGALLKLAVRENNTLVIPLTDPFVEAWLFGNFKKITCYVNTDQELEELYQKALSINLPTALIKDSGLTEFNGVPTLTAVGIGPGNPELIDTITGKLPLF